MPFHDGQRLSFEGTLATVRYSGPVQGTKGNWIGVEWDDPSRGKHNGTHQGVKYFQCKSGSMTAASFVRPTRSIDRPQTFISAVRQKYASSVTSGGLDRQELSKDIEISGKIVEEVGFDKIRKQLAQLNELKIVLVDGLRIHNTDSSNEHIRDVCPKIVELDLSRNLFEDWKEISSICQELENLESLRLNGNRLSIDPVILLNLCNTRAFPRVSELYIDEMLLMWSEIVTFIEAFPYVRALSANGNELSYLSPVSPIQQKFSGSLLKSLTLEYNSFKTLADIEGLTDLHSLEKLHLKGNMIKSVTSRFKNNVKFGNQLFFVDLSHNDVRDWAFVDQMHEVFPGLTSLRFSHNPIYENTTSEDDRVATIDETFWLTIARLRNLKSLNFSNIAALERANAEMFYLSRIQKAMAAVPKERESTVTSQHARFNELCKLYGVPEVIRAKPHVHSDWLDARLIKFNFNIPVGTYPGQEKSITKKKEIPRGFDTYQIKGIVGHLFNIPPLNLRLIWETGEWDPVAGYEYDGEESSGDEIQRKVKDGGKGKWVKREVELEESTRPVGNTVDDMEAAVRIELRQSS